RSTRCRSLSDQHRRRDASFATSYAAEGTSAYAVKGQLLGPVAAITSNKAPNNSPIDSARHECSITHAVCFFLGLAATSWNTGLFPAILSLETADIIRDHMVGNTLDEALAAGSDGPCHRLDVPRLNVGVRGDHSIQIDVDQRLYMAIARHPPD